MRWGQDRERHLLQHGPERKPRKEVPTLEAFAPRFIDGYAVANRQKPSGIAAKGTILSRTSCRCSVQSDWTRSRTEDVQKLKQRLRDNAPKTVNNVLTVLSMLLKKAVEWDVDRTHAMRDPAAASLRSHRGAFHDFDGVRAARRGGEGAWAGGASDGAARWRSGTAVRRDDGASSGVTWISSSANCACSGRSGMATSRLRKEGGCGTCR